MDNMAIYNAVRKAPASAVKKIRGGAYGAAGLSDVSPQWRIEMMTQVFGPVGSGWYHEIVSQSVDRDTAYMQINLYYKVDGEWSKPIPGFGGTPFGGKNDSDVWKSTETDALSNAMRKIGIGANVWYDPGKSGEDNQFDTKFSAPAQQDFGDPDEPLPISKRQVAAIIKLTTPEQFEALEKKYGKDLANMNGEQYVKVLSQIKERLKNKEVSE